jgi:hypothetical protein
MNLPPDFSLIYEWNAASVPPPFHYEYKISISADGSGKIIFIPDYPSESTPVWQMEFRVTKTNLENLFSLLHEKQIFRPRWGKPRHHLVGGSQAWLFITVSGVQHRVPASLTQKDTSRVAKVYDSIRSLVPVEFWDRLQAQRQQYEDEALKRR